MSHADADFQAAITRAEQLRLVRDDADTATLLGSAYLGSGDYAKASVHLAKVVEADPNNGNGWFNYGPNDVWTLFHSLAFDFSVWEIWGALLYGGRLVVVPYLISRMPEEFYRLLRDRRVTVLNQTPSAFRQVMQADLESEDHGIEPLRLIIFGGEALDLGLVAPHQYRIR